MTLAPVLTLLLLSLAGCGGGDPKEVREPGPTVTSTVTEIVTEVVTETAEPPPVESAAYPKGFPRKVKQSAVPFPINSQFEGMANAVAVAPGVWTELAPGTTAQESADAGSLTGYCASIDVFVKKYRDGEGTGGSCW